MRIEIAIGALLATAACGGHEVHPRVVADLRTGPLVSPPTPAYGGWCAFPEGVQLIASEEAWQTTWAQLFGCASPLPPLPAVDFGREMLVLAALGGRPTGGYTVAIHSAVVDEGAVLRVQVIEERPGRGCAVAAVATYPVAVARVPRADVTIASQRVIAEIDCGP